MDPDSLTTAQAATVLGVSRQHMANLGDRGHIASWRVGTHRRFRLDDVLAYRSGRERAAGAAGLSRNLTDRRSFVYSVLVAAELLRDPQAILAIGRKNLARRRALGVAHDNPAIIDRWEALIDQGAPAVLAVLLSPDEESTELRHTSPFAGVLDAATRDAVIAATRNAA